MGVSLDPMHVRPDLRVLPHVEQNTYAQLNKIPQLPMEWTKVKRKRLLSKVSVSSPSATFQSNNGSIVAADHNATTTHGKKLASSTDDKGNYFECCNGTICWDQINHPKYPIYVPFQRVSQILPRRCI